MPERTTDDFDREIEWPDPDPRDSTMFQEFWARRVLNYIVKVHMEKRSWPFVHPEHKTVEIKTPGDIVMPGGGWMIVRVEFVGESNGES